MIDTEVQLILSDMLFHTREMLKFLRRIKKGRYDAYLDDLVDYALCTEEDIQTIEHYIFELSIQIEDLTNNNRCHYEEN